MRPHSLLRVRHRVRSSARTTAMPSGTGRLGVEKSGTTSTGGTGGDDGGTASPLNGQRQSSVNGW